jgi:hypothetical protein
MENTDRVTAADHLSLEEIRIKMKMTSGFWKTLKWLVIYNAIIDPRPESEIAKHTGLSISTVQRILAEYNTWGPEAIEDASKCNRRRYYAERYTQ